MAGVLRVCECCLLFFCLLALLGGNMGAGAAKRNRKKNRRKNNRKTTPGPQDTIFDAVSTGEPYLFEAAGNRTAWKEALVPEQTSALPAPAPMDMRLYPNPLKDISKCGRYPKKSWICDPANILSHSEADSLDKAINQTCAKTKCACSACNSPWLQQETSLCEGYSISVALVSRVSLREGSDETDQEEVRNALTKWADALRETMWAYGNCEDNVVLLLDQYHNEIVTSAGRKAKESLLDHCIKEIHTRARRALEERRYAELLATIIDQYTSIFIKETCEISKETDLHPAAIVVIALFSAFTIVIVISAACCVWGTCRNGDNKKRHPACKADDAQASELKPLPEALTETDEPETTTRDAATGNPMPTGSTATPSDVINTQSTKSRPRPSDQRYADRGRYDDYDRDGYDVRYDSDHYKDHDDDDYSEDYRDDGRDVSYYTDRKATKSDYDDYYSSRGRKHAS